MSKVEFISPPRGHETDYVPIHAPIINHPSRDDWKNEAIEAYIEVFGENAYRKYHDLPIPFPTVKLANRIGLASKTLLLKTMFTILSFFSKERGTHEYGGVGGKGFIRFYEDDLNDQMGFSPNENLPLLIRHSNASFEDDGCSQLRAMAFKITNDQGPVDFLLSTGAILPFWSLDSLMNFAGYRNKCKDGNWDPQKEWLMKSPTAFVAAAEATRLAPSSYRHMSYYSAICFEVKKNGPVRTYVKFRVVPDDMQTESGLLNSDQQRNLWDQGRLDGNDRPLMYLADEFKERLQTHAITYKLQAQVRNFDEDVDSHEFFNSARYWDDLRYPWKTIADISIDQSLDDQTTRSLKFWLGNAPSGLGIVKAQSSADYNSVGTGRTKIYPLAQRARS